VIDQCTATWPVIYAWTGNGYSDVSSQYKGCYEKLLASLQKLIAAAEASTERTEQSPAYQQPGLQASAVSVEPATRELANDSVGVGVDSSSLGSPGGMGNLPVGIPILGSRARPPAPPSLPDGEDLDCTKAEAAKIERFLGVSPDAGMSDAIKWSESDNPRTREFAAGVLEDIGTPEAIEDLRSLSRDSDRSVAESAKTNLLGIQTPHPCPFVHAELVIPNSSTSTIK
jgi:hypothetical protein